jgi:hypothetical protein
MDNIIQKIEHPDIPKQHPFLTLSRRDYYGKPDSKYIKLQLNEFVLVDAKQELIIGRLKELK